MQQETQRRYPAVSPNTVSSNLMLPQASNSKKDQRPQEILLFLMIPLCSPTPESNNKIKYIKLIPSKIVSKQKIV